MARAIGQAPYSYTTWKYDPASQLETYRRLTAHLDFAFKEYGAPTMIVCRGTSSIFAVVPMIPWLAERGVLVFMSRKPGENSHGAEFEGRELYIGENDPAPTAWFIDDFTSSGETVRAVVAACDAAGVRLTRNVFLSHGGTIKGIPYDALGLRS